MIVSSSTPASGTITHTILANSACCSLSGLSFANMGYAKVAAATAIELMAMWTGPGRTYAVMIESDLAVLEKAGLPVIRVHAEPATIGNRGRYIREQIWGEVVIVTNRPQ